MKHSIYKTLFCAGLLSVSAGLTLTSCEDYLDKAPESTVSEDDAFKNFRNFQGFILQNLQLYSGQREEQLLYFLELGR